MERESRNISFPNGRHLHENHSQVLFFNLIVQLQQRQKKDRKLLLLSFGFQLSNAESNI